VRGYASIDPQRAAIGMVLRRIESAPAMGWWEWTRPKDGSASLTSGRHHNIVLELSASEVGPHLRVVDPVDPAGGRAVDMLEAARATDEGA